MYVCINTYVYYVCVYEYPCVRMRLEVCCLLPLSLLGCERKEVFSRTPRSALSLSLHLKKEGLHDTNRDDTVRLAARHTNEEELASSVGSFEASFYDLRGHLTIVRRPGGTLTRQQEDAVDRRFVFF